ncbi:MAG TPA: hypothetical protein VNN55_03075 [bacterium]|nr:hypothetical protein [bacterium]
MGGGSSLNPFGGNFSLSDAFRSTRNTLFGSPQRTSPQVFTGYYQGQEGRDFADTIRRLAEAGVALPSPVSLGPAVSAFRAPYQSAILDRFQPTSAESDLLATIADRTAGQLAARGLGATPVAASATAASIAPALVELRQRQIDNLRQALGGDVAEQQALANLALTQRGQTLQGLIAEYATRLQSLLNLFEAAALPRSLGSETRGGTNPILQPIDVTKLIPGSKPPGGAIS